MHDAPIRNLTLSWFAMTHSERLAQMYILKLRHPNFNSNAGAVWRQLFVLAMMPWIRKHRVFSAERALQAVEALAKHKLEVEEDNMGLAERLGDDVQALIPDAATNVVSAGAARAETGVRFVVDTAAEAGHVISGRVTPTPSPSKPEDEDLNQTKSSTTLGPKEVHVEHFEL